MILKQNIPIFTKYTTIRILCCFLVKIILFAYCTAQKENGNCIPKKWLFRKNRKLQWVDIPEKYKENVNLFQKQGDFNTYELEI